MNFKKLSKIKGFKTKKTKRESNPELEEIKKDGKTTELSALNNISREEAIFLQEKFVKNNYKYGFLESVKEKPEKDVRFEKNAKKLSYDSEKMFILIYNKEHFEFVRELMEVILKKRTDEEDIQEYKNDMNNSEEWEKKKQIYKEKYRESMLSEDKLKIGTETMLCKSTSFNREYYINYIPFQIYAYLDKELEKIPRLAAKYIGNGTIALYYTISERKDVKKILMRELSDEELKDIPTKVRGSTGNLSSMKKAKDDIVSLLRNMEITGMEVFEEAVEQLSQYGVDFSANSIGREDYIVLFNDLAVKENLKNSKKQKKK